MNVDMRTSSANSVVPIVVHTGPESPHLLRAFAPKQLARLAHYASGGQTITFEQRKVKITLYLCLDFKSFWTYYEFGGVSASAKCVWCKCNQQERQDPTFDFSSKQRTPFPIPPGRIILCM